MYVYIYLCIYIYIYMYKYILEQVRLPDELEASLSVRIPCSQVVTSRPSRLLIRSKDRRHWRANSSRRIKCSNGWYLWPPYHLQWFRTETARCAYSCRPLGFWPLMLTCTRKVKKGPLTYGLKGGETWSRTHIHKEFNGYIGSEQWSQHIQIWTPIHWFIDRSICHGRYRQSMMIHPRENTVDIDCRYRFTNGELRSIVDRE